MMPMIPQLAASKQQQSKTQKRVVNQLITPATIDKKRNTLICTKKPVVFVMPNFFYESALCDRRVRCGWQAVGGRQ